jgi:hypothetical protein
MKKKENDPFGSTGRKEEGTFRSAEEEHFQRGVHKNAMRW